MSGQYAREHIADVMRRGKLSVRISLLAIVAGSSSRNVDSVSFLTTWKIHPPVSVSQPNLTDLVYKLRISMTPNNVSSCRKVGSVVCTHAVSEVKLEGTSDIRLYR